MCLRVLSCGLLAAWLASDVGAQSPDKPVVAAPFVAVVRDADSQSVTLWSVPVGEVAKQRAELGNSPWSPTRMAGLPELLRWQVPHALARGYEVRLLRVDYESLAVTEALRVRQAHAIGEAAGSVYLRTSEGQRVLHVATGKLRELEPEIVVLAKHGNDWLVVVDGAVARFDAVRGEVVRRCEDLKLELGPRARGEGFTDWDGGRFAVVRGRFCDADGEPIRFLRFGEASIVYRELRVWDLENGAESRLRVRMQARGGSGEPVIPMEMKTELVGGMFRYTERRPAVGKHADLSDFDWERDAEWVTVDVATSKELLREPYRARDLGESDPMDVHRVPAYLRDDFRDSPVRVWGPDQDLAHAFLVHKGIDPELPTTGVCKFDAVARTADGDVLLVLLRGVLYRCDLQAQTVTTWAAPAAWQAATVDLFAQRRRT